MKTEKEIKEAIKDKEERLKFITNPRKVKACKLCGHAPSLVIGGDEPWADIGGYKRNSLTTAIDILKWVLEEN